MPAGARLGSGETNRPKRPGRVLSAIAIFQQLVARGLYGRVAGRSCTALHSVGHVLLRSSTVEREALNVN